MHQLAYVGRQIQLLGKLQGRRLFLQIIKVYRFKEEFNRRYEDQHLENVISHRYNLIKI